MWLSAFVALVVASAPAADERSPLLAPGASWEKVAGGLGFGEGPAWHPDGYLLFEDVANNRTLMVVCEGNGSGGGRRPRRRLPR